MHSFYSCSLSPSSFTLHLVSSFHCFFFFFHPLSSLTLPFSTFCPSPLPRHLERLIPFFFRLPFPSSYSKLFSFKSTTASIFDSFHNKIRSISASTKLSTHHCSRVFLCCVKKISSKFKPDRAKVITASLAEQEVKSISFLHFSKRLL